MPVVGLFHRIWLSPELLQHIQGIATETSNINSPIISKTITSRINTITAG